MIALGSASIVTSAPPKSVTVNGKASLDAGTGRAGVAVAPV